MGRHLLVLVLAAGLSCSGSSDDPDAAVSVDGGEGDRDASEPSMSVFLTIPDEIQSMTLSDGFLYWFTIRDGQQDANDISRVSLTSTAPSVLTSGLTAPIGMMILGNTLYWADRRGPIQSIPITGAVIPTVLYEDSFGPTYVESDDVYLYWSTTNNPAGRVSRIPLGGGAVDTLVDDAINPRQLVAIDDQLYYGEYRGVYVVASDGSSSPVLLAEHDSPAYLSTDGTYLYWRGRVVNGDTFEIARMSLATEEVEILVEVEGGAGLGVDDTYIYYGEDLDGVDGDDNFLWRRDKTGAGPAEKLFENLPGIRSIIPHEGGLYFNSADTIYWATF